ncbi:MAG: LuxR C-terminal-related transcriptional regulator [Fimbriimonadales bacterium]
MSREVAHTLSPREAAILTLASEGHTDAAIAQELGISEGTVGTYWGRIRTKLGPYSRPELVAIAVRSELTQEIEKLENQRNQLRRELEETTAEEHLLEEILDAADEGVLLFAASGRLMHANPVALSLFSYQKDQLAGLTLSDLIPERFRQIHLQHYREFSASPTNRRMNDHSDTWGFTRDGIEVPLYVYISAVCRDGETLMACFIRPGQEPIGN